MGVAELRGIRASASRIPSGDTVGIDVSVFIPWDRGIFFDLAPFGRKRDDILAEAVMLMRGLIGVAVIPVRVVLFLCRRRKDWPSAAPPCARRGRRRCRRA